MNNFPVKIPLLLKGFDPLKYRLENNTYTINPRTIYQINFKEIIAQDWYVGFKSIVFEAIGKRYLPIYRMADGEFRFCLNFLSYKKINRIKKILKNLNFFLKKKENYNRKLEFNRLAFIKHIFDINLFWIHHGEYYTSKDKILLIEKVYEYFNKIASLGILALHFVVEDNNTGYASYIEPMIKFFREHEITLDKKNYFPFYFVYALLSSRDCDVLFRDKNILIVSNFDKIKKKKLEYFFNSKKVNKIDFYNISPIKSFFDVIHPSKILIKPDLVLIGGGVGTLNILAQLEFLNVPCIDAGYILEMYANPNLKGSRIFIK